jgi:hypothetical protein
MGPQARTNKVAWTSVILDWRGRLRFRAWGYPGFREYVCGALEGGSAVASRIEAPARTLVGVVVSFCAGESSAVSMEWPGGAS